MTQDTTATVLASSVHWEEAGEQRSARWRSERGAPPPRNVVIADDRTRADDAYGLACQGTALLWRGDFQNARQLLVALAHRVDRRQRKSGKTAPGTLADIFNRERQARSQRARTLGMLLIELEGDYRIALRRAPDLREACTEAWGPSPAGTVTSLRELLGLVGAHEWRVKGIEIPAAGGRIHPHYGVFAPTRGEYVNLVAQAPLPAGGVNLAFDVGTGTGVLAAVLARRGVRRVIGTDLDPRAIACAMQNIEQLGLAANVEIMSADLFPPGRAQLIVCNPPWVPARPSAPIEYGIYDPESRMLRACVAGLAAHLEPGGEGWLILSDLAEHLGLRTRDELLAMFDAAGLTVAGRIDARPRHPKASDASDPLHVARSAEVTSLWRLTVKRQPS